MATEFEDVLTNQPVVIDNVRSPFCYRELSSSMLIVVVKYRAPGPSRLDSLGKTILNASSRLCASFTSSTGSRRKRSWSDTFMYLIQRRTAKACAGHGRRVGGRRLHRAQSTRSPRIAQDQVPDGTRDRDGLGRHGTNMELGVRRGTGNAERGGAWYALPGHVLRDTERNTRL